MPDSSAPFSAFAGRDAAALPPLRAAIAAAHRLPEPEIVPGLIAAARVSDPEALNIRAVAEKTVKALRAHDRGLGMEGLIHEYSLSSDEGIALMCLAEALLRIPDAATRDRLIADKIAHGAWDAHLGRDRPLFVNAATWGLAITGKLVSPVEDRKLSSALSRLVARAGEPVIRAGVALAIRMMGEIFVSGETIEAALRNGRKRAEKGFTYSFDMLGEAAATAADAARYFADYAHAIKTIGQAAQGMGVYRGNGISIKLSALHPRYARAQYDWVLGELYPRLRQLAELAKGYDIGLNIDAEEADRLETSLDLLERLATDPALADWDGIGFVVQAYSKRAPAVIDWIVDLARRSGHRIMVRLVKGAYWDSEIKRAQIDGLADFPVYTRKVYTDLGYIACAKKLLAARDAVFPQFATHNAQTMATIFTLAGPDFALGDYEFQCLFGMGEPLYDEVVGPDHLDRPCRIYAPVGKHETLLAYLVRRLLENGANSSFVNQIADHGVPVARLVADPVDLAAAIAPPGAPHPDIALPAHILSGGRVNSRGLDLSSEPALRALEENLIASAQTRWTAGEPEATARAVRNPADHRDVVGQVHETAPDAIGAIMDNSASAAEGWAKTSPAERAAMLLRAADLMDTRTETLMGIAMREAGKTAANVVAEVREAIDFLRYYAQQGLGLDTDRPLGPVVCISPWNFPLAIFTGQVAAALVAGNPVVAKPAEETPLIAAQAVAILHEAGVPPEVLHLVCGDGAVGAALVAHEETHGVMFTGSTEVARLIARQLARSPLPDGTPRRLVAETGGQNALVVDSSALTEQVVADVIASAFDSAGQRCSALRILCLQDECAARTLAMLKGAMDALRVGNPDRLATDIGPVISPEARDTITAHIAAMEAQGHAVTRTALAEEAAHGTFVPPTLIEIADIGTLGREVFGPVLHVVRFKSEELGTLVEKINALGYGLTFGLHTRIDSTIAAVTAQIAAGNIYINRNQIGAVVGVQPFGGHGLSGTGPKAGGPLYLSALTRDPAPKIPDLAPRRPGSALVALAEWARTQGGEALGDAVLAYGTHPATDVHTELSGPVGETNLYATRARGNVLVLPQTLAGLAHGLGAALAAGNDALVETDAALAETLATLPQAVRSRVRRAPVPVEAGTGAAVLCEGDAERVRAIGEQVAAWDGPIVRVQGFQTDALVSGTARYGVGLLVEEVSISTNTAAAGGNATLMASI